MANYDEYQQIFALSMASNVDAACKGDQSALQACIKKNLPPLVNQIGPEWSIAWGPVVYQAPGSNGPDNTWYVANNKSMKFADGTYNTYVVAIAGTATEYDWNVEDYGVGKVADFDAWVNGGITNAPQAASPSSTEPCAAMGTVNAVFTLITTPTPSTAYGTGTLYQYLTALPQASSTRIIFTGHSLGGALSPTIALAFLQAKKLGSLSVLAYPTAGPTPGNAQFANCFNTKFPKLPADGSGHKVWNCNIVNSLDVIPLAWNDFKLMHTIYGNLPRSLNWYIDGCIIKLKSHLAPDELPYAVIQSSRFPGRPPSPPLTSAEYKKIVVEQHIEEYHHQFNPSTPYSGAGQRGADEDMLGYPILGDLVRAELDLKAAEAARARAQQG